MTGDVLPPQRETSGSPAETFGQLDMFIEAEQAKVLQEIDELESHRPNALDPLEQKIAYNGLASVLQGRAEELARLREQAKEWRGSFTNDDNRDTVEKS